jgi:serine/threonine protein phosphatase 1
MKKRIWAVSDIHGNYDALIKALNDAGYNEEDEDNLLIVIGDHFDRGRQSLAVYEYLKRLSDEGKAIVLKGNHDSMFIDYLNGTTISPFNYFRNGEDETFAEFLHETRPFESWCLIHKNIEFPTNGDFAEWLKEAREEINKEYPELLPWLEERPYYYETKNYIFTHGAIDTKVEDWHQPHCYRYDFTDWEALLWNDGSFFGEEINNTDKTVVIGHFGTDHLRNMYELKEEKGYDFSILKREDGRIIAIDSTNSFSNIVNVLLIEGEELL